MMIGPFIKKDLLHFIRDRKELAILLLMPFVLISILGFSLKNVMGGDGGDLSVTMAIVDEGSHVTEAGHFQTVLHERGLSKEQVQAFTRVLPHVSLPDLLIDQILDNEQLSFIELTHVDALDEVQRADYDGVIYFPEGYRIATWKQVFLGEDQVPAAQVYLNEKAPLRASIVDQIVDQLYRYWNIQMSLNEIASAQQRIPLEPNWFVPDSVGSWEFFDEREPISSFDYYTVGMCVMFALFVVAFIASYGQLEKQQQVFQRVMLANVSPWVYMISKWVSGTLISFVQLIIVFTLSSLVYQTTFPTVLPFVVITIMFSITVGALAVLMTSFNYHFQTTSLITVFSSGIVSILAFVGGSFFDIGELSESLYRLGQWTPNGAALNSYLYLLSGGELSGLKATFYRLAFMSALFIGCAWLVFPKRGEAQ
ncbi:ABC transporter permease [Halalkalibacterium halodurans]|uniref:ABC-2 type transporter transmembrane domain-containing protein n=1 Tax=Halalkalibacterium halodurans TaxID=86665 RepID=A0A0M0KML1_ALKHA|nr:ABC transporter permease [Halalkalibacterium halodurans]TPE70713.1 ABC transporter permease [Halalkalibacterium halodurans]